VRSRASAGGWVSVGSFLFREPISARIRGQVGFDRWLDRRRRDP
jgi:hypothetical protein